MSVASDSSPPDLEADLLKLQHRAWHFAEWTEATLRRYHSALPDFTPESKAAITRLYSWLFVPTTLWPFNIHDVLNACLEAVEQGQSLNAQVRLLIDLLADAPDESVCDAVAAHEHFVQRGSYEDVVNTQAKFAQNDLMVRASAELQQQWAQLKAAFDITPHANDAGVIRRTMATERNMRPTFHVDPQKVNDVFRAAFDAFCQRWHLYGMQHDEPLLMKFAVNLTPFGTMIFIPSYWSLDPKRDIRWDAIARLQRTRVSGRQGSVLAAGRAERKQLAEVLGRLDQEAKKQKLKGRTKHEFLCDGLGWVPDTSPRRISRLRAEFRK